MQIIISFACPVGEGITCALFFQLRTARTWSGRLFVFSSLPRPVTMRLRSLCGVLLLCLCAIPFVAAGNGQTLGIRRPHQPRNVDRITRTYLHSAAVTSLGESRHRRPTVGPATCTKESVAFQTSPRFETDCYTRGCCTPQASPPQYILSPPVVRFW